MSVDSVHWDAIWSTQRPDDMSWHQLAPEPCASIIRRVTPRSGRVAVIGAGASPLVQVLAADGLAVTAIDVSATAIRMMQAQSGTATGIECLVADARSIKLEQQVHTWHDRALLHFFTAPVDQQSYAERAAATVRPDGHLVIATFAPHGPEQCSGFPVVRHGADSLSRLFDGTFELTDAFEAEHSTPQGAPQPFLHATFRRLGS